MAIAAWKKAIEEFIGAFTLIFIGAGAIIVGGNLLVVAFAHGLAIGVMASAFARISGGHFNPAVTLGALVGRQITARLAAVYWAAQLLGALAAALALFVIFPVVNMAVVPSRHAGSGIRAVPDVERFGRHGDPRRGHPHVLPRDRRVRDRDRPEGDLQRGRRFAIGLTISIDILMAGRSRGPR